MRVMNERECHSIGSEPPSEDDILTAWALRFDAWKYCEETSWAEEDRLRTTDLFIETLVPPAEPLKQLAVFFMLQRLLYKWGGETLSRHSNEWKAFRTLFLMTASYEVDLRWRAEQWYEPWEKQYRGRTDFYVGIVARAHAAGYSYSEKFRGAWCRAGLRFIIVLMFSRSLASMAVLSWPISWSDCT
jgi:hypothetical protein